MARPAGSIALKAGDRWSADWPKHIELANGRLRRPIKWRGKCTNVYYKRKICTGCQRPMLQTVKNASAGHRPFCSTVCKSRIFKSEAMGKKIIKKLGIQQGYYVLVKAHGHPRATNNGTVREHILVVEKQIGRFLSATERVHHIDFVKHNNDPENLFLCRDNDEHLFIHRSLNLCVADLLAGRNLYFDHQERRYRADNSH